MIYFDNAATTYPKPDCVYKAVEEGMRKYSFNAGRGSYASAQETYEMIRETREMIGSVVGKSGDSVVFTSSATESLNNIIYGMDLQKGDVVFVSPFEHNAVVRTLHNVGAEIVLIPFNKNDWSLDLNRYKDMLQLKKPKAVIISHISNVTGFELPNVDIFRESTKIGAINVLDCAQSFGIYDVDTEFCDYVVFAGHKSLYAVFGIAGYVIINDRNLSIYKVGGTGSDSLNPEMPENGYAKYEAGSLNSVGIYAVHESLKYLSGNNFVTKKRKLVTYCLNRLAEFDKIVVYCPEGYIPRGIISLNIEGYTSSELGDILGNDYDICVRTGYHCAPYVHDFIESKDYSGTVRISFGIYNSNSEIDELVDALASLM